MNSPSVSMRGAGQCTETELWRTVIPRVDMELLCTVVQVIQCTFPGKGPINVQVKGKFCSCPVPNLYVAVCGDSVRS